VLGVFATLIRVPDVPDLSAACAPILVRRARPADAADFVRMMGQPEVYSNLMQLPMPSEEMWRKRLEGQSEPHAVDMHLVAELDGRVVGSAGLHPAPQLRRRHVAMLGISVDPTTQSKGVGTALMRALCEYADGWAQILRIELTVFTDNARAIRLYERFGFRLEGTHRAYALCEGVFADVHAMARLHPHPPRAAWPFEISS